MTNNSPNMIDNTGLKGREDKYQIIEVDLNLVLKSWKISLFSFEWLTPDGNIRKPDQLPENELTKHQNVLKAYQNNEPLERPILGIGLLDNVEIGSRRDVLLTLYTLGVDKLSVHVPNALLKDFEAFQ